MHKGTPIRNGCMPPRRASQALSPVHVQEVLERGGGGGESRV